jgi:hypothetical protein
MSARLLACVAFTMVAACSSGTNTSVAVDAGLRSACSSEEALKSCPECSDGGIAYAFCVGTHSACSCAYPTVPPAPSDAGDGG